MAINQARQHCHARKIDDRGAGRNCQTAANRFNFIGADEDHLIGQRRPRIGVDQGAGLDRHHLRARGDAPDQNGKYETRGLSQFPGLFLQRVNEQRAPRGDGYVLAAVDRV